MTRRNVALVAMVASAALGLAACTPAVPQPVSAAPAQETSAVTQLQVDRIVPATFAELAAADEARDGTLLGERVAGDAAEVRAFQYREAGVEGGPVPDVIPEDMQAVYVTDDETWPRVMVGVTAQPDETTTPVVVLWVQDNVEADYRMVGWAHMIPGATLPAMPGVSVGAPSVDLEDPDLNPNATLNAYLELLRNGSESEFADDFEEDTYRRQLFENRQQLSDVASRGNGTYSETFDPHPDRTYAIATSDGGALLFAPVTVSSSLRVTEGATVTLSALDAALIEGGNNDNVRHTYRDLLVLALPADPDALPAVVAADHQLIGVNAD